MYIKTIEIEPLKIAMLTKKEIVLKSKRGDLYLLDMPSNKFRFIPGPFQFAKILNSSHLAVSNFGTVYVFYLKKMADVVKNEHSLLTYTKFDAHYENLSYLEFQGSVNSYSFKIKSLFYYLIQKTFWQQLQRITYLRCLWLIWNIRILN